MSRDDVLAALRGATSALTIAAIADQLGVHPNTVRFHLDTLVSEGRVERVEPDHRRPGQRALHGAGEGIAFPVDGIDIGSVGMLTVVLG